MRYHRSSRGDCCEQHGLPRRSLPAFARAANASSPRMAVPALNVAPDRAANSLSIEKRGNLSFTVAAIFVTDLDFRFARLTGPFQVRQVPWYWQSIARVWAHARGRLAALVVTTFGRKLGCHGERTLQAMPAPRIGDVLCQLKPRVPGPAPVHECRALAVGPGITRAHASGWPHASNGRGHRVDPPKEARCTNARYSTVVEAWRQGLCWRPLPAAVP